MKDTYYNQDSVVCLRLSFNQRINFTSIIVTEAVSDFEEWREVLTDMHAK